MIKMEGAFWEIKYAQNTTHYITYIISEKTDNSKSFFSQKSVAYPCILNYNKT